MAAVQLGNSRIEHLVEAYGPAVAVPRRLVTTGIARDQHDHKLGRGDGLAQRAIHGNHIGRRDIQAPALKHILVRGVRQAVDYLQPGTERARLDQVDQLVFQLAEHQAPPGAFWRTRLLRKLLTRSRMSCSSSFDRPRNGRSGIWIE
ncbi:hypothetical protein D3C80_1661650 [compost metagenome]